MHMNSLLKHSFGKLSLKGDISRGLLHELSSLETNLHFHFEKEQSLFKLELEIGNTTHFINLHELDIVLKDNEEWLNCPEHEFYVQLNWQSLAADTVTCTLHFETKDPKITLRRIHYALPGKVTFPHASGTDYLMFPKASGMKIPTPATEFFKPQDMKYADWKDRQLFVWNDGFQSSQDIPQQYDYASDTSMGWLDYYCEQGGLYMGAHDKSFDQTEAKVSVTQGEAGVKMELIKTINRHHNDYQTDFALALHSGDWHRGADIYRQFYDSTGRTVRKLPSFMKNSPGIMCHYDFKWQDGSVNHTFKDIEAIYDEAVSLGYNQILIAGWNHAGFDNCYPDFTPAPELGTEQDMIDAVNKVKSKGGGVFFYINAFSFDKDDPNFEKSGANWAVKTRDGNFDEEVYATSTLVGMCNSSGWREKVKSNLKYILQTIGANGVYIDQLNVIPRLCYDQTHQHNQSWKLNNNAILHELRQELGPDYEDKIFLFCEWATDGVLPEIDALLIQACWYYSLKYSTPEMFRYTFPEMAALDMIMQKPWAATPASLEQAHVKKQFCKMFINGIMFWTYDHVPYTPGFNDFFKQAIKLKNQASSYFSEGLFIDDTYIEKCSDNITAKAFVMKNGSFAICIWNTTGEAGEIQLKKAHDIARINTLTLTGNSSTEPDAKVRNLDCPKSELSIIILEK